MSDLGLKRDKMCMIFLLIIQLCEKSICHNHAKKGSKSRISSQKLPLIFDMVIPLIEFQVQGYKTRNIFAVKIGHHFINKVIQKLMLSNMSITKNVRLNR